MASAKILHVCDILCARQFKELIAQQQTGRTAAVLYQRCWHQGLLPYIFHGEQYGQATFAAKLKALAAKHDVIHVLTTIISNRLPAVVRQVVGDKARIVWDIHDLVNDQDTVRNFELVNGVVCPSQTLARQIQGQDPARKRFRAGDGMRNAHGTDGTNKPKLPDCSVGAAAPSVSSVG